MSKTIKISFKNNELEAEIANTFASQALGLMFRKTLPQNCGMLFVFKNEHYIPITMFGMRFPLDIVWLDADKKIVEIKKNANPRLNLFFSTVYPRAKAKYVLEVNAGVADKLNFSEGAACLFTL